MNFLKKLFGMNGQKQRSSSQPVVPEKPELQETPTIRVADSYGREFLITRDQWRENILLGNIEKRWSDPEALSSLIIQALQDNFIEEMVAPAEHLVQLDGHSELSTTLLAITYHKTGKINASEKVLTNYLAKNEPTAAILNNLAKVYDARAEEEQKIATLWQALQQDPNHDNSVMWYISIFRDADGEDGALDALKRLASLPHSWRAQAWLARHELTIQRLDVAMTLYKEALENTPKPVPTDLLMQMTGDLGNAGHFNEIIMLGEPAFDVEFHGLQVGNNLIKANLSLGRINQASDLLNKLFSINRLDWRETLNYWDTEIGKAKTTQMNSDKTTDITYGFLTFDSPLWMSQKIIELDFFGSKPESGCLVSFISATVQSKNSNGHYTHQLADVPGRLSRSFPLYLAEQIHCLTSAHTQTYVPWLKSPNNSFVMFPKPWETQEAVTLTERTSPHSDFIVLLHLIEQVDHFTLEMKVIQTKDQASALQTSENFKIDEPQMVIQNAARQLINTLKSQASVSTIQNFPRYDVPGGEQFAHYLLHLEQLLAIQSNGSNEDNNYTLNGERNIIEGNLTQCLELPLNLNVRFLLLATLKAMKKIRPDIIPEFRDRVLMLQKEYPLPEPAHITASEMLDEIFTA
jgi:tetratricopeptide (TPR) repeat protein